MHVCVVVLWCPPKVSDGSVSKFEHPSSFVCRRVRDCVRVLSVLCSLYLRPTALGLAVGRSIARSVGQNRLTRCMYINAPEGCPHSTHTNRTAYTRGTHSREHTQTHTNTNKHTVQKCPILNMTIRAPDPFLGRKEGRSFGVYRPKKTKCSPAARRAAGRSVGTGRVENAQNRPRGSVPSVGLGRRWTILSTSHPRTKCRALA